MKHSIFSTVLLAIFFSNPITAQSGYESYFLYHGTYPEKATTDWFPNDREMQGVANDNSNWYFTCTNLCVNCSVDGYGHIWKIPVSIPLSQPNIIGSPGVEHLYYPEIAPLSNLGFTHFGDPDYYEYEGTGYLVVPLTGTGVVPGIAFFKTNPLSYVNYALLDILQQGGDNAGWCAVDKNGDIITSPDNATYFSRYSVDWPTVVSNPGNHNTVTWEEPYYLLNSDGSPLLLHDMQGGDFSPSEEILYVSCGTGECAGEGHGTFETDGIWVINTANWKVITHSTNRQRGEYGPFDYDFENNCNSCSIWLGGSYLWVPEGLTVWDLDSDIAPSIRGQLHVILTRWAKFSLCDDEFNFEHYSNKLWIDRSDPSLSTQWEFPFPGLPENPFNSLNSAYNYYPVWDGAQMVIKAGTYNDTGIYNKRIKITSEGGTAVIGQ